MQKLYIMFCYIEDVGGGQIYVNSKVPWLEAAGWDVIVFSPLTERSDSIVPWTNLAKFAANKVEGLNKSPEFWSKKKMKAVLEQLQSKCSGEYSEIIIESHTDYFAEWGELLAEKLNAKNICYLLDEQLELYGAKEFLYFKYRRNEVAGITDSSVERLFAGYAPLISAGYLDVLSIGSSQLSQSNFGENWDGKPNGGSVPVNREQEYRNIWEAANPMLVRTYSGTKNVAAMADVYERTINIAWHALSLWWFDELDGRGPNTLYDNLKEHIETMRLVAAMGKPVETNVPHHFAFRGCDDVTYIVTGILAARMAKKCGVKNFVLQNMLNTPRSTWGVQDLAKSRAMLHIAKELEDDNFRIILQSRAGLDYFKPDLEAAKIQLASVTAMMDDIDPDNDHSPDIIHVVSYCEALYLATPDIINDSIKITRTALKEYRRLKKLGLTPDVKTDDIAERTEILETSARKILAAMEETIPDLYSPEGLYIAFVAGWLPVPELWSDSDEFIHAKCWETKMQNGGTHLVDHELLVPLETRINKCIAHNADAEYILKSKYKVLTRV